MKLKEAVKKVIDEDPRVIDNDKWLVIQVLRKLGIHIFIDYSQLKKMPSFESITRCKRNLQVKPNYMNMKSYYDTRKDSRNPI